MKSAFWICCCMVLCYSCQEREIVQEENEVFVINQLVILRTEGLALAEIIKSQTEDKEVSQMSKQISMYYEDTHSEFLELCEGRMLLVEEDDFDAIWQTLNHHITQMSDTARDATFFTLYENNILKSIALYEIIIKQNDWEDISYFSFKALPELYNQQQVLNGLSQKREKIQAAMDYSY